MKTKDMIVCAIFAAILCVFSSMTIPIGAVPISMGVFGVVLTSCILDKKRSVIAVAVYILLGAAGMPVFSGFKGGLGVIAGPTGGYITSYILMALFIGYFTERLPSNKAASVAKMAAVSFGGIVICYFFGTLQFMFVAHKSFAQSLAICVYPFIPFDIVKSIVGAAVSYAVRTALVRAKVSA